jgi:hypothetical protein
MAEQQLKTLEAAQRNKNQEVWSQKMGQGDNWAFPFHPVPHLRQPLVLNMERHSGMSGSSAEAVWNGGMRIVSVGKEASASCVMHPHSSPPTCPRMHILQTLFKHYCKEYIRFLSIFMFDLCSQ